MERACLSLLSIVGLFACIAGEQALAQSQPAAKQLAVPSMTFDCTNVTVDYSNDPSLTREEKLQLMDQALSNPGANSTLFTDNKQRVGVVRQPIVGGALGLAEADKPARLQQVVANLSLHPI